MSYLSFIFTHTDLKLLWSMLQSRNPEVVGLSLVYGRISGVKKFLNHLCKFALSDDPGRREHPKEKQLL